jgi:hypothetical protein
MFSRIEHRAEDALATNCNASQDAEGATVSQTYWDVWGWRKANNWVLLDTFVDESLAREHIDALVQTPLGFTRFELRKSTHLESFSPK